MLQQGCKVPILGCCLPQLTRCHAALHARAQVVLPPMLPPSLGFFRPDGAYLINNGQVLVVWLGRDVPAAWLTQVRRTSSSSRRSSIGGSTQDLMRCRLHPSAL